MDVSDLEEILEEYMPGFSIEKTRKGELLIYTNLKENEDGELIPLDHEEVDEDPNFDGDVEAYTEDEED